MNAKTPRDLLAENVRWAEDRIASDPEYFQRLSSLQSPDFLWIGCSDSRVPANVITGLEPGEVFVHRNVANIVYAADLNCMSVVKFAVDGLKVKHIIVCGHYGCGGVRAVLENSQEGLVDHWLAPVHNLYRRYRRELATLETLDAQIDRVCELNVVAQVDALCHSPIVVEAWERGQELAVHGWIYRLSDGRLRDLKCGRSALPVDPADDD
ncbi:carbonic anhydrase [Minwuia thermotolerans]|uniref:Carbonic anhydrase 2 n=1 Tax=Minwuia thermotolerans TaxID=2056226 RepID=A0A2M9FY71_9PROT|nr:carbonic anhydrase [Minwuia thermotolerans]PJK28379.1 carbonic anhydrase [Minwuia thermotolerans]